jgi:choline dehydrogenase-like flavoprotein
MRYTARELRFRSLLRLWLFLFGAGTVVTTAALWVAPGPGLYAREPLLAFAWLGQIVLLACTVYLLNGLRDHELVAAALFWYKVVSGAVMLLMLASRGPHPDAPWAVVGGGLLDFVMGGATLWLWTRARRSKYQRLPFEEYAKVDPTEEPRGGPARAQRIVLASSSVLCAALGLGGFVALLAVDVPKSATFMIASGNAVATFAALGFAGLIAADAPRRRPGSVDVLVLGLGAGAVVLAAWLLRFPLPPALRVIYGALAATLAVAATAAVVAGIAARRAQRTPRFLSPALHEIFEKFADVLLRGDRELVRPRQIADDADAWLASLTSERKAGLRFALWATELVPLLRGRLPLSRMGRMERGAFFATAFRHGLLRDFIRLRALVMLFYYSHPRGRAQIGFVEYGDREGREHRPLRPPLPKNGEHAPPNGAISCDVCVIGSGAGGAVVAQRLREAGRDVILVEEGSYLRAGEITHDVPQMQARAYRDGGLLTSRDFDLSLLQGRCVGGSTFLNNGICIPTPDSVIREWQRLGCSLTREEIDAATARVIGTIGPLTRLADEPHRALAESGARRFEAGCKKARRDARWFDVNLSGCLACGYCTTGCAFEKKQSMDQSFIPRFVAAGGKLFADTAALRVEHDGARATGVRCRHGDREFTISAKEVVVSCGVIHSSLLLQRSGIHRNVGTRVSFNVGSWVFAEFPDAVNSFDGLQMCGYTEDPRYLIETMAMPPGVFAASMPGWFEDHFDHMRRYTHYAVAGALVGTQPVGRVREPRLARKLRSPLDFELPLSDLRKLRSGVKEACRIWLEAGALRVLPATQAGLAFTHQDQLDRLDELVVEAEDLSFGSAHPQGGNPMSDDLRIGAIDSRFRVHGFGNLRVVDASVFPTSARVNPQLTIMALADVAAQRMLS